MSEINCMNCAISHFKEMLCDRCDEMKRLGSAEDIEEALIRAFSKQPEIIRCKDCAKREYCRTSTVWAMSPSDDWFCGDAVPRKED